MDNDRIERFSKAERLTHWVHTISFFALLMTGLVVFSPKFAVLANLFGGVQNARIVHRVAAVVFSFGTLFLLFFGDRPAFIRWIRDSITWDKTDITFLQQFPKEFFGGHPEFPEQGRFNSGEKVNSLLVLGGGTVLTITGLMMWFSDSVPLGIVRWAYPLHDLMALTMAAVIIGHMYLGLLHPGSKESINGMLYGSVKRSFAKAHHAKWYREVTQKETIK
ncbi:MAG: formate dehydrogenase subunit gamma [Negativicutes bacterium]|nr:formate dehydrogenase subunit gamma [Negativicutes bacterium]